MVGLAMNEKLKLYLIKRKDDFLADYDEYNAILVAASDEKIALNTALNIKDFDAKAQFADKEQFNALNCTIELIGISSKNYEDGTVVIADFNAG